jgi:hypothetical protein
VQIKDEEHLTIPVGVPITERSKAYTAFSAAANVVPPATGDCTSRL